MPTQKFNAGDIVFFKYGVRYEHKRYVMVIEHLEKDFYRAALMNDSNGNYQEFDRYNLHLSKTVFKANAGSNHRKYDMTMSS